MAKSVSQLEIARRETSDDARVQKTLENIRLAFHELVMGKEYDQITVGELCKAARIGRKTFYMHYSSLDDLMERTLAGMVEDYVGRIRELRAPDELREITRQFYLYSEEQGVFYEKLVCSDGYQAIGARLLMKFVSRAWQNSPWFSSLSPAAREFLLCFIHSTGSSIYRQWVTGGRKIPLEEMVDFSSRLLLKGIEGMPRA